MIPLNPHWRVWKVPSWDLQYNSSFKRYVPLRKRRGGVVVFRVSVQITGSSCPFSSEKTFFPLRNLLLKISTDSSLEEQVNYKTLQSIETRARWTAEVEDAEGLGVNTWTGSKLGIVHRVVKFKVYTGLQRVITQIEHLSSWLPPL